MGIPCRHHSSELWTRPELPILPREWNGSIIYLDRDGVLNIGSENYINSIDEFILLDGVPEAVGELRRNGYRTCLTTNQSPINRGIWGHDTLEQIHDKMLDEMKNIDSDAVIDLLLYSPYAPWENSISRKPSPGMLRAGNVLINWAEKGEVPPPEYMELRNEDVVWNEPASSAMVGDRLVDYRAGLTHGVRTFLVESHIGLPMVINRVLDMNDKGDHLF